jgi:hypothetical protein
MAFRFSITSTTLSALLPMMSPILTSKLQLIYSLGFNLSNSKTISPSKIPTCLVIQINLNNGTLHVPMDKLQDVIALCQKYINKNYHKKWVA